MTAGDSAGSNDGTINGATWTTGQIGGALSFDGVDDTVNVGNLGLAVNGTGTISLWMKGNAGIDCTTNNHGVTDGSAFQNGIIYRSSDCDPNFRNDALATIGIDLSNIGLSDATNWHHLVGVADTTNGMKFYIDGVSRGTDADTGGLNIDNDFIIGGRIGGDQVFDGIIDEVRVYNRALSAADVTELFNAGGSPPPPPPPPPPPSTTTRTSTSSTSTTWGN